MADPVLLVDDDEQQLISLSRALGSAGLTAKIQGATTAEKALELAEQIQPYVAVIDLSLNEIEGVESGYALLAELKKRHPSCRVIVLTGHGSSEFGIRALKSGAASFLEKPADSTHLCALINDSIDQAKLYRDYQNLQQETGKASLDQLIIGTSKAATALREDILYAASTDQPVFLGGETGTGKSLCAQAIHDNSRRRQRSFVKYQPNFAGPDLIASELFGHAKGSFTGAEQARDGLIHQADAGTLFLDEIDVLPINVQASLLGVLQEKTYRSVGEDAEKRSDFRLVSASNRNLEKLIEEEKVRADFVHRVAHYRIEIPALRQRKEDIPSLCAFALEKMRRKEQAQVFEFAAAALDLLESYDWPGNVRELLACVESAAYKAQFHARSHIDADDITLRTNAAFISSDSSVSFHEKVEHYKLKLIEEALRSSDGNQVQAAKELGLDRSSMRRILARNTKD